MQSQVLTDLYVEAGATRYSQAVAMGQDDFARIHVVVPTAATTTWSWGAFTVRLQGSADQENWTDVTTYTANVTGAPSTTTAPSTSAEAIRYPTVRLQVNNGSPDGVILSASITTFRT